MFPREDSKRRCSGGCVSRRRAHQLGIIGLRSPSHLDPASASPHAVASNPLQRFSISTFQRYSAFTLLELLIVIGIIAVLLVLIAPALTTIKSGTDVTSAAYTIKGVLDTARTYAKANNTYTWVGFTGSIGPNAPQNISGQVKVAIVASKDGTNLWSTNNALPSASLVQVGKMMTLDNIHVGDTGP